MSPGGFDSVAAAPGPPDGLDATELRASAELLVPVGLLGAAAALLLVLVACVGDGGADVPPHPATPAVTTTTTEAQLVDDRIESSW